jgi:ParB family transcriptional regulator, chromosome partitioning protein
MPDTDGIAPAQAQVASQVFMFDPCLIKVGPRWRQSLNREGLEKLKESVRVLGVKVPISVRRLNDAWDLVAGQNRLQACIELDLDEIPCREETGTNEDALRWEISENLHRIELIALERAKHIEKWIELTAEYRNDFGQVFQVGTREAARDLDLPVTTVHRARKIAKLPEETQQAALALGLDDNQRALEAAASEKEPAAQKERLREHAAKPRKSPTPKPTEPATIDGNPVERDRQHDDLLRMLWLAKVEGWPKRERVQFALDVIAGLDLDLDDLRPEPAGGRHA